ncbi:MAG: sulfatase-like hydrolase/transferase, partial [Candidatus Hydrogenedentales bacterium]
VTEADKFVGEIVASIKQTGIEDKTVVMVVSDHGGKDKGHGGATMEEIVVPWIIAGPGVKSNHEIRGPVDSCQTAPTIAHILGLKAPECWIAAPVFDAFARRKRSSAPSPSIPAKCGESARKPGTDTSGVRPSGRRRVCPCFPRLPVGHGPEG